MDESRSPRFFRWISSLIFSIITLGSLVRVLKDKDYQPDSIAAERWAVGSAATKFIITVLVVCFHLNPITSMLIIGTKIEGAITLLLTVLWAIKVAIGTYSSHGIAVDGYVAVENGNLYYFSWAGFVTSVTLLVSYLQHVFGLDVAGEMRTRSARLLVWSALLASSIVVMGSSANYYDTGCGGDGDGEQLGKCNRAVFGIVLGALTTLGSVGVVGLKIATSKAPFLFEAGGSLGSVVLYGFGVAFITSQQGPVSLTIFDKYILLYCAFVDGKESRNDIVICHVIGGCDEGQVLHSLYIECGSGMACKRMISNYCLAYSTVTVTVTITVTVTVTVVGCVDY